MANVEKQVKKEVKVVLRGDIREEGSEKVGVISVVLVTQDRNLAQEKMQEMIVANPDCCYMMYSIPMDMDLTTLMQYPSMAITKEDLE